MRKASFIGLLAAMLCAAAPLAAQAAQGGTEIPLSGHINAAMAGRVHAALGNGKPHVIRITSSGGEDAPALAIAADIARSRSSLVVDGICAGPCATYLFIAATRRSVQPGGLVIFTASATSRLAMVPLQRRGEISRSYADTAQQEARLLREARVSAAMLLEPQLGLEPKCWSLTSRDNMGKAYINYQARAVGWTPSRAYMARAGLKIAGYWPEAEPQFQAALQKALPGGARGGIVYSTAKAPAAETTLLDRLQHIAECDSGFRKR